MAGSGKRVALVRCQLGFMGDLSALNQCPYDAHHQVSTSRMAFHLVKCRRNYEQALAGSGEEVKMMACKYNRLHQIVAPEINYHEEFCSDQYRYDASIPDFQKCDEPEPELESVEKDKSTGQAGDEMQTCQGYEKQNVITKDEDNDDKTNGGTSGRFASSFAASNANKPWSLFQSIESESVEEDWGRDATGPCKIYDAREWVHMDTDLIILQYPPGLSKSERKAFREANIEKARRAIGSEESCHGEEGNELASTEVGKNDCDTNHKPVLDPSRFFKPRPRT